MAEVLIVTFSKRHLSFISLVSNRYYTSRFHFSRGGTIHLNIHSNVEMEKERYLNQCKNITSDIRGIDAVKRNCLSMFQYQTTDESLVAFRRLLLLEKFKNPEIAEIYKTFFVDIPLDNQIAIFEQLQKQGLMITGNTRVFAMELYAPFYLYHFVEYDPEKLISLFETHLEYFFKQHFIPEKKTT